MAAADQDTSSSSVNSEGSQMKYKIDVKKKGLFVVIKQVTHNLYFPTNAAEDDWSEDNKELLNYGPDQKGLEELFHLKSSSGEVPSKPNYIEGIDLENGSGNGSFDGFMKKLCNSDEAEKPEFLMFILMSHGFEDGKFLLACKNKVKAQDGRDVSQGPCCEGRQLTEHTFGVVDEKASTGRVKGEVNECFARDIKHVIRQVCKSKRFSGVPKVFFIQVCRGGNKENLEGLSNPIPTSSDIELFIPNCEDSLVIRASTESCISKVQDDTISRDIRNGSLLLQSFCQAVEELQQANQQHKRLLEEIEDKEIVGEDVHRYLEECREDLTGGWVMNVCQRTTALVTNYLIVEIIASTLSFRNLLCSTRAEFYQKLADKSKVCQELMENLYSYARQLKNNVLIVDVTKICEEKGNELVETILHYLHCKLSRNTAVRLQEGNPTCLPRSLRDIKFMLSRGTHVSIQVSNSTRQQVQELEVELENLVKDLRRESPDIAEIAKLYRLCYREMRESKEAPGEIIQRLKDLSAEEEDVTLVEDLITLCEDNLAEEDKHHVVTYLWVNLRRAKPISYISDFPEIFTEELETKLNTMIGNIQLQSAYGKQQPHISSSLSKKLSMIDILETQKKAG